MTTKKKPKPQQAGKPAKKSAAKAVAATAWPAKLKAVAKASVQTRQVRVVRQGNAKRRGGAIYDLVTLKLVATLNFTADRSQPVTVTVGNPYRFSWRASGTSGQTYGFFFDPPGAGCGVPQSALQQSSDEGHCDFYG